MNGGGNTAQTPRYTDINLQTSAQGLPIPIIYGQNRLGTNLIWYNDFSSRTTKQAGKGGILGGGGGSTYYYQCAVIMALCEGPIKGINTVWAGSTLTSLSALDLTLFTGTATQTPWGYLTSKHPSQALAYARTAYVASGAYQLGSSPDLPSHNFEVIGALSGTVAGMPDANPADIILDYLTNPQYSIGLDSGKLASNLALYKTYCAAQGIFLSPVCDEQEQVTQTLQRWAQLTNSFIFWSGNQLQFCPLGDSNLSANGATYEPQLTPIYNLTYDDFVVNAGEIPVTVNLIDPVDGYNQVEIDMYDRANYYNNTPITWQDQTSIDALGKLQSNVISAKEICQQSIGQICAALIGKRSVYITKTYTFKLSRRFIVMEPGDIYTLTDPNIGLNQFPVRILSVKSGKDRVLSITAEEFPYGIGTVAQYATQASEANTPVSTQVAPGNVNTPAIFEPNAARTGGKAQVWVAASGGANWGGCQVWASFDGDAYSNIGTIDAPSLQGVLITALPATADPDTSDDLYVNLIESFGVMPSTATHADADALRTLSLVDNELLAYGSVVPGALNSYSFELSYLRRGQYGTSVAEHAIGASFTRVDPSVIFTYDLPFGYVGTPISFKFVSFNIFGQALQDISDVEVYTYTPVGTAFNIAAPGVPVITPARTTQSDGTTILSLSAVWSASSGPNLGSYETQWSTNGGTSWTNDATVGSSALSTVLAPALASTSYLMRVRAISQNGQAVSGWSTSASTSSGALISSPPAAPTDVAATAQPGGALVTYTPSTSESTADYQISYGTSNVFADATLFPVNTTGPGLLVGGLTPGTLYYFWVQAANVAGASSPSGPATATPSAIGGGVTFGGSPVGSIVAGSNITGTLSGTALTLAAAGGGGGGGGGGGISFGLVTAPAASQTLLVYPVGSDGLSLPAGLPGFAAYAKTTPTGSVTIELLKNGTSIGSVNWSAGAHSGNVSFAAEVSFASGDVLTAVAPATPDATFANFGVVLVPISGGSSGPYVAPLLADFTIGNQPSGSTFEDTDTGLAFYGPTDGLVLQALVSNATIGSTFTLTIGFNPSFAGANTGLGLFVMDASGKIAQMGISCASAAAVNINYWNSFTSFNSNPVNGNDTLLVARFVKVHYDGTNFYFYSGSGKNSMLLRETVSATAFIGTPESVGLYQYLYEGPCAVEFFDWELGA